MLLKSDPANTTVGEWEGKRRGWQVGAFWLTQTGEETMDKLNGIRENKRGEVNRK